MMALAIVVLARPVVGLLALYSTQPEHVLARIVVASEVNRSYDIFNAFSRVSEVICGVKTRASVGRELSTVRLAIRRCYRHCFGSKIDKIVMILVYLGGARKIGALMPEGQSLASPTVAPKICLAGRLRIQAGTGRCGGCAAV